MRYPNIEKAVFLDRPNRFTARVELAGRVETVHVKNTGRLGELLRPGAEVWLTEPGTAGRKTRYDLVAARKADGRLVNVDSQAPNAVAGEWLAGLGLGRVVPESRYGASRLDFFLERAGGAASFLLEVKGCTLERGGLGWFPDAPTERGLRHLHALREAAEAGYRSALLFVIQMDGVTEVRPNVQTQPAFGAALAEARAAGVGVLYLPCHVEPDILRVTGAAGAEAWLRGGSL
ncbi:MAG: DNA/RNA nuclease SfsA [Oscillospiraceae bacterium]|nr:DNA/RNA nuclease SfsA [Oscillospiraceae bacterium]